MLVYFISLDRIVEAILEVFLNIALLLLFRRYILHRPIRPCLLNFIFFTFGYSFLFAGLDFVLHKSWEIFTLPGEAYAMFLLLYAVTILISYISYKIASRGYWKWAEEQGDAQ